MERARAETQAATLAEILREAERVLDAQAKAAEELDDKTEQLLNLAVAALAGAVTLGLFVARGDSGSLGRTPFLALVLGASLNLGALRSLLGAYNVRFAHEWPLVVGPDPQSLERASRAVRLSLSEHLRDIVASHAGYYRTNQATISRAARARAIGLHVLVAAMVAYGIAFALIAGARI